MKKQILLLVMALLPLVTSAQINDETELVGLWKLMDYGGEFKIKSSYSKNFSMQKPEALKFYAECNTLGDDSLGVAYYVDPEYPTYDDYGVFIGYREKIRVLGMDDYFITSSNILHILFPHSQYVQRYRITYYDGENITLETLDNKAWIKMSREGTASVPAIKENEDANERYYNLEGKINYDPKKGINIANGKKYMIR